MEWFGSLGNGLKFLPEMNEFGCTKALLFTTRLDENHTDTNYVDSRGTKTQLSE